MADRIRLETLQVNCKHSGMIKNGKNWCSIARGYAAKCWDDWDECCKAKCPLIEHKAKEQIEGQMDITEFLEVKE